MLMRAPESPLQSSNYTREVVIDVETTGFSPRNGDRIVSIALIEIFNCSQVGATLTQRINPRRAIPIEASNIHGITDADVMSSPTFSEISQRILEFIGGSALVGYNVNFDLNFLRYEFDTLDIELPTANAIDVMELVVRHSGAKRKLHLACSDYQIDLAGIRAHSAEDDALVTARLYAKLRSCFSSEEWEDSRFLRTAAHQRDYENDALEQSWRHFLAKNYDDAIKLVYGVIESDAGKDAAQIDARPYELGAMILRRMKQLDAEKNVLFEYFRRAIKSDITPEGIVQLAEPPPTRLLTEAESEASHASIDGFRPAPQLWELAARFRRTIELGKPVEDRLYKALKAIPSPYGYQEAAICFRKIISDKEKKSESVSVELDALYRFAQQHAFLYEEMYDHRLGYSVHVIVEQIPRDDLKSLTALYDDAGYKFMPLLKKSDIRRLVKEWGEPRTHASMKQLLMAKWQSYRAAYDRLRSDADRGWVH